MKIKRFGMDKKITCKNCGKDVFTRIPGAELCSIPCIKEWNEEKKYAESLGVKK